MPGPFRPGSTAKNPSIIWSPWQLKTATTAISSTTHARASRISVEVLVKLNPNARVSRESVEGLVALNPNARVSQEAVETVVGGTSNARVSQEAVETVVGGTSNARVSQVSIEVVRSVSAARLSQEAIETAAAGTSKGLVSQEAVEAAASGTSNVRVSQEAIEVAGKPTTTTSAGVSQAAIEVAVQLQHNVDVPFIASVTQVYGLTSVLAAVLVPFIPSHTVVYGIEIGVHVPFIPSKTVVYPIFSIFDEQFLSGVGNGGELFPLKLAPNGTSVSATLGVSISATDALLILTGDSGLPATSDYVLHIGSEVLYVSQITLGSYRVRGRGMSNTAPASHTAGATVTWTDSYDMAIGATEDIDASFTADITMSGSFTYPGWLISFDSTQAYIGASRYPMHVTSLLGVFDAQAGTGGTNRCDAAQPNSVCTPATISDNCPAALSVPSRIAHDINPGDVALVRYTNPEASIMTLGCRSAAIQSWFGFMRVNNSNVDVTFSDPNGNIVDGSKNGVWHNPLGPGISPSTGLPTNHDVPYTSVTLPGTDRTFTYGPPRFSDKGWPICATAVRQGHRRIPYWQSWDWHDYSFIYAGFDDDATFCQMQINRNGIVFQSVPEVILPGPQNIDGPDDVWDDKTYYFAASWYIVLFNGPYIVVGPVIGGGPSFGGITGGTPSVTPVVTFTGGVVVTIPPYVEGGAGGGQTPGFTPRRARFDAHLL